jgi:tetratricopeptide (TPR) repeat protein
MLKKPSVLLFIFFVLLISCSKETIDNKEKENKTILQNDRPFVIVDSLRKHALYDSANVVLSIAFNNFIRKKEYQFAVDALREKAINYEKLSLIDSAFSYCNKALSLSYEHLDSTNIAIAKIYLELSLLNRDAGNLEEALKNSKKSESIIINRATKDDKLFIHLYNNLATIYIYKNENKKALNYLTQALNLSRGEFYYTFGTSSLYNNI